MIKVSVVIPVYNADKYLNQCVDSVVNQTLKDIEIILVNDASTDNSLNICNEYKKKDDRIKIVDKPVNQGLAAARNSGMEVCNGEYVVFLDSDDWVELDAYEKMYNAAKSNDSDIVFCNCIENEDGHRFSKFIRCGAYNREQIKNEILPKTLSAVNKKGSKGTIRWSNCLRMFKMETLEKNNIRLDDRFRRCQDLQLTYEATICAQNYYYLGDEYLYHNRVVESSLSRGYTKNMWQILHPLIERLYSDTENFKEMDLMPQMHLCNFFFAVDVIQNELKNKSPYDKNGRIDKLKEIINDSLYKRCLPYIKYDVLNEYYKGVYKYSLEGQAEKLYSFHYSYLKKQKRIAKRRKATGKLTENKIIGTIYVELRCLVDKDYKARLKQTRSINNES